jgi:hypothetical protein
MVSRSGLSVVGLERAIVESWPQLNGDEQRAPAIMAVRERRTTVERLVAELPSLPKLPGRGELGRLLALIGSGCHSELELWGYDRVFSHPDLPPSDAQVQINLDGRIVYLDRLFVKSGSTWSLTGQSGIDRLQIGNVIFVEIPASWPVGCSLFVSPTLASWPSRTMSGVS